MSTITQQHPDLSNVGANALASGKLDTGPTYHSLSIQLYKAGEVPLTQAEIMAQVEYVTLKVGSKAIIDQIPPAFLHTLLSYYNGAHGYEAQDGVIFIDFTRTCFDTAVDRMQHALGTQNLTVQLYVKLKAGATVETIRPITEGVAQSQPLGLHRRIQMFPKSHGSVGVQQITDMEKVGGTKYQAIWFEEGAGTIKEATLKIAPGVLVHDGLSAEVNKSLQRKAGRTPQAGYYTFDFLRYNNIADGLPVAQISSFLQELEWTVAPSGTVNVFTEREFNGLQG